MKKNTLLSALALLTGLSIFTIRVSGQITITQADMPSIGLTVVTDSDGTSKPSPGVASSSTQTWNYGTLLSQKIRTVSFMSPSATPWASTFAASNLADSTYGIYGYNYFSNNPGSFSVEGSEQNDAYLIYTFHIEMNLNPMFEQASLPATYGTKLAGVAEGSQLFNQSILFLYDSERIAVNIAYADTVDAWGSLTTPSGTFNVLRLKHWETDVDSIFLRNLFGMWAFQTSTTTYKNQYDWYTNGAGYILVEMDMDSVFSNIKDIIWDNYVPTGTTQLSSSGKTNVYPNPCSSQVNFSSTNQTEQFLTVYDVTGRQLETAIMKNGMTTLNTSAYSNGLYLYTLKDQSGNMLDRGKFSVQK